MDDRGGQGPLLLACCGKLFCGDMVCTDSIPPHCMSSCTCSGDGQTCRQELDGRLMTERACCDGFACTGCIDPDTRTHLCVCRPQ